jgi:hypothetical protein
MQRVNTGSGGSFLARDEKFPVSSSFLSLPVAFEQVNGVNPVLLKKQYSIS